MGKARTEALAQLIAISGDKDHAKSVIADAALPDGARAWGWLITRLDDGTYELKEEPAL